MMALTAAPPLPRFLQLEPVGQCNLRCQMCPIQFRRDGPPYGPPAFMAFETFRSVLEEFEDLEELHLQGLGEPMMHPRFFEMVEYATARGVSVSTNSNCTLLNAGRAERCVESGLHDLHISLDGATAETVRADQGPLALPAGCGQRAGSRRGEGAAGERNPASQAGDRAHASEPA
jgi:MoaA/NifB/PqqE/SkfB family radical SAM enzyme